ncbi:hypothetical protein FRX31_035285, partial [Thalictrum thalictroides]
DSYGEDIGETESDPCDDDEDEYEEDFIDDGDIEFFPDSPRQNSGVIIEEMLDDEKPAKVNGNRKRLKKKYQVSDSDGDAQNDIAKNDTRILIIESDDEEGLPLSSVIKIKRQESDSASNDQKQNIDNGGISSFDLDKTEKHMPLSSVLNTKDGSIQEKSDKKEFMGNKTNEAQDGGDQITAIKWTIEGCEIERGAGCVGHNSEEKPKKKKKKQAIESQCGRVENDLKVDVPEEENFVVEASIDDTSKKEHVKDQPVDNLYNDKGAGCVGHNSEEKPKKKKKKQAIESQCGRVENDLKVDVPEEENFVVEASIDDTSKKEHVKDQPVDNLYNDKEFIQSSHENAVKTKKKHKKHAKERQTTELGNDNMIDVQEENIQVKEAVNNDFNQEVLVKDNAVDIISIDKKPGCIGHESEKPKKKKKKRGKESQNVVVENDSKIDVQEAENCKVEARIDDISKNEPVKDQANDNLSFDKAVVQSGAENDVKTKRSAKDRQTSNAEEDSMSVALKEEKFQIEVAGGRDTNQEVPVKDNAIENDSNDKGVEKPEAGIEIQEKPTKKRKKRTKERPTDVVDNICDAQKEAKSLVVKGKTDDVTHEEPYKDESIQLIGKKDVQGLENGVKVKKKKKHAKGRQTSEVGDQSIINAQMIE